MASTAVFSIHKILDVPTDTFISLFFKPAARLRLRGEIVPQGPLYHFRVDGSQEAVREFLSYVSIGSPAFGRLFDIQLWVGEQVLRDEEALAVLRPPYRNCNEEPDDAVVPVGTLLSDL